MKATVCKLLLIVNLFAFTALSQTDVEARIKRVAANGNNELVIANYKKSLEPNPGTPTRPKC